MRIVRRRLTVCALTLALTVPLGATPVSGTAAPQSEVGEPDPALLASPEARAMWAARRTGQRVELTSQRTETGEVFANPDGTKTMAQHPMPVRVRKSSGWVAPDPTLRRLASGRVEPVATVSPISLSGGGDPSLVSIGKTGARVHLGWPHKLPAPQLQGDTATYAEVLPGVDLRIKVGVDNFSHLLVVKNRAAALNPALRSLRYPVRGDGLTVKVRPDGTTVATDRSGQSVFTAGTAMMWDTPPAQSTATQQAAQIARGGRPVPKQARVGLRMTTGGLVLTPDRAMLTDPAARFPLLIDPSLSGLMNRWMHVNVRMGNQTAWGYDPVNDQGVLNAKVGRAWNDTANLYRSNFLLNTTNGAMTIAGSNIISATFRITLDHSPSGTGTPVELWHLRDLDPGAFLNWGNTVESYWIRRLDTRNGNAWTGHQPDMLMEFAKDSVTGNDMLKEVVQAVATNRASTVSLGLRAPNEGNEYQWKKFHPGSASIEIKYNTKPRMPKGLTLTRPKPCGTAGAPTPIATKTPQWAAVANDPDIGDNVTTTLQILNTAGTVVHTSNVGPTVSGAAFSWPETPAGTLTDGVVYRYRAFTTDAVEAGPATPDCYFVIDSVKPQIPRITSTDYPDGEPGPIPPRSLGTVTFRPGGTDTDIAEYAYGFQAEKTTMRIKAGADGTATVPITLHPDLNTGLSSRRLYVRALDKAGNTSSIRQAWDLEPNEDQPPVDPFHKRGDSNGDGKADVTALFDHGFGRTAVWNVTSTGTGFHTGVIGWDAGEGAGFSLSRIKPVQGDWDYDGRTDMAVFREGAGRKVSLYKLNSDGNRYDAPPAVWPVGSTTEGGWPLSTARTFAGDVDGDNKDDIVVQIAGTGDNWRALVFRAANNFSTPTTWVQSAGGNTWSLSAPLLADIDGDGKADLLSMRNLGGCRTAVDMYKSTGTAFAAPTTIYDSGAGGHCWDKTKPAVADADGDGRSDVVVLYENTPTDASLFVFRSDGTALTRSEWRRTSGLDLSKATLAAGDFDGDNKEDAAVLYAGGSVGDRQVYTFRSTGAAFDDKVLGWNNPVGAVTGPKFEIEHRQYELINKNSGKCLNVAGQSYDNGAAYIQWDCLAFDPNARFRLMPIAGTDQYSLRPVHTAQQAGTKCADVFEGRTTDDVPVIQYLCGGGNGEPNAWQQVTFEYVDGSAFDTVVQLKFAHSNKCLVVDGARLDSGAPIQQETCGQTTNQQWILRPTFNATQLGSTASVRYRTEAATNPNLVLDVENCQDFDGGNIRMWRDVAGSPCESWKLESLGDDVYKIIDNKTGKAVDIEGCSKLPKATVHIWNSNESECQKWRIEPAFAGGYSVIAVSSGLSLDVAGCSSAEGADVITWFYHGGPCQRWFFKPR